MEFYHQTDRQTWGFKEMNHLRKAIAGLQDDRYIPKQQQQQQQQQQQYKRYY